MVYPSNYNLYSVFFEVSPKAITAHALCSFRLCQATTGSTAQLISAERVPHALTHKIISQEVLAIMYATYIYDI